MSVYDFIVILHSGKIQTTWKSHLMIQIIVSMD